MFTVGKLGTFSSHPLSIRPHDLYPPLWHSGICPPPSRQNRDGFTKTSATPGHHWVQPLGSQGVSGEPQPGCSPFQFSSSSPVPSHVSPISALPSSSLVPGGPQLQGCACSPPVLASLPPFLGSISRPRSGPHHLGIQHRHCSVPRSLPTHPVLQAGGELGQEQHRAVSHGPETWCPSLHWALHLQSPVLHEQSPRCPPQ